MENPTMEIFDYFVNLNKPESNQRFANAIGKDNVLFLVNSKRDAFAPHTGHFSFKTTFKGRENFEFDNHRVAVNPQHYLLLNDGQEYGSSIDSDEAVEAFTIFFSPEFVSNTLNAHLKSDDFLLDNVTNKNKAAHLNFFEKLYQVNPHIGQLTQHIRAYMKQDNVKAYQMAVEEYLYALLHELLKEHRLVTNTIGQVSAVRHSTRVETYKRVSRAKDYLLSCYDEKPEH